MASGRASREPSPNGLGHAATIADAGDLRRAIVFALSRNPDWLPSALEGISMGMSEAIRKANERASLKDQATLATFALKAGGRMSDELRQTFLARIVAAIHPANQCGYERGLIDAYAQGMEARSAETTGSARQGDSPVRKDAP